MKSSSLSRVTHQKMKRKKPQIISAEAHQHLLAETRHLPTKTLPRSLAQRDLVVEDIVNLRKKAKRKPQSSDLTFATFTFTNCWTIDTTIYYLLTRH